MSNWMTFVVAVVVVDTLTKNMCLYVFDRVCVCVCSASVSNLSVTNHMRIHWNAQRLDGYFFCIPPIGFIWFWIKKRTKKKKLAQHMIEFQMSFFVWLIQLVIETNQRQFIFSHSLLASFACEQKEIIKKLNRNLFIFFFIAIAH